MGIGVSESCDVFAARADETLTEIVVADEEIQRHGVSTVLITAMEISNSLGQRESVLGEYVGKLPC